jgi:ankyrin repeat protein
MNTSIISILDSIETSNNPDEILNNIIIVDNNGNSLLHHAIQKEYLKTIFLILNKNINLNIQNNDGNTVLHMVMGKIIELSKNFSNKLFDYINILKIIVDKGGNLDIKNNVGITSNYVIKYYLEKQDYMGNTIMHILISYGNIFLVKFLIEKFKPNLNIQNIYGDSILHIVSMLSMKNYDNIEYFYLMNYLLKNGAKVDIKNKNNVLAEDYINFNLY